MDYRTVLVHLDHTERSPIRASMAARWARAHEAHLVGLVTTGVVDGVIPADLIAGGSGDFIADSAEYLRRRAESIARAFGSAVAASGPLSCSVRLVDGDTRDAMSRHGRTSDLVVVGQSDHASANDTVTHGLPDHALLETGRPVLVVPSFGHFDALPRRTLVAWDGSREAGVAIRAALPALRLCTDVTLVAYDRSKDPRQAEAGFRHLLLDETVSFLERHGIRAVVHVDTPTLDVPDALLNRVADSGAELLVMGGYGHSRLRERVAGGVTRRILAQMTVPVLLAH